LVVLQRRLPPPVGGLFQVQGDPVAVAVTIPQVVLGFTVTEFGRPIKWQMPKACIASSLPLAAAFVNHLKASA
jgi:hypothetical protein